MSAAFYRIEHDTRYVHAAAVSMSQHVAYLAPRRLTHQAVHEYALRVEPEPADHVDRIDYYGNAVAQFSGGTMIAGNWADSFAAFGIAKPYDVTAPLDDFILPATSILKGKATDGKDVGADIAAVP